MEPNLKVGPKAHKNFFHESVSSSVGCLIYPGLDVFEVELEGSLRVVDAPEDDVVRSGQCACVRSSGRL
jgi:hypothetical protein